MKTVISASRRTDLPALFPGVLAGFLRAERARVLGPRGGMRDVDLAPTAVHTIVLWSKDFAPLLTNAAGLRDALAKYDQAYFLFTVTGLGGTPLEPAVPAPAAALAQLPALVALAGHPRRVSLRFDPVVFWRDGAGLLTSNLDFFAAAADAAARAGLTDVRFSAAQWYRKAGRRARARGFAYADPPDEAKRNAAAQLAETAAACGLRLHACAQAFLSEVPGIFASSCIDGRLLGELHPRRDGAPTAKDRSQRAACGCTVSVDIGSYAQTCAHGCVYCYANPRIEAPLSLRGAPDCEAIGGDAATPSS
jgi:hypothetical protein